MAFSLNIKIKTCIAGHTVYIAGINDSLQTSKTTLKNMKNVAYLLIK